LTSGIDTGARVSPPKVPLAAKFHDFVRREIKRDELLRALIVVWRRIAGKAAGNVSP